MKIIAKWKSLKLKHRMRKKVRFGRRAVIDGVSQFEGGNSVAQNSCVLLSSMGYGSYCASNTFLRSVRIGRYCCIGKNVRIVDVTHPSRDFVSMHPAFYAPCNVTGKSYVDREKFQEKLLCGGEGSCSVEVGNDVWICDGALIIGGNKIGNGAIVAAGAVVTKDVPAYAIVAGVPAKVVRYRFDPETIEYLEKLQWWNRGEDWIASHADAFESVEKLKKRLGNERV